MVNRSDNGRSTLWDALPDIILASAGVVIGLAAGEVAGRLPPVTNGNIMCWLQNACPDLKWMLFVILTYALLGVGIFTPLERARKTFTTDQEWQRYLVIRGTLAGSSVTVLLGIVMYSSRLEPGFVFPFWWVPGILLWPLPLLLMRSTRFEELLQEFKELLQEYAWLLLAYVLGISLMFALVAP
jgi:hypothetical protein